MSVDFIDTNVIIYLFDETAPEKRTTAEEIIYGALESKEACLSFQVVQETLNVLTGKIAAAVTPEDARIFFLTVLSPLWKVMPTQKIYLRTLEIQNRYGYGFYDSLILSEAIEGGCERVLSEDLQDGQQVESVRIVNPFTKL